MPLYPPGSGATLSDATPANVQPGVPDAGVATEASRDDHAHDASWSGVAPSASAPGDAAATGAAQGFNRRDHVHGREAVASQAEMEAGTEAAVRAVSPLRVKQAIDALGGAAAHIADATDAHDASAISIVDVGTLITATEVEGALQEIAAASASAHIADATDAHDASAISFDDTGLGITATDVQTMGEQLDAAISAGGIPATVVDVKGDLIVATAADTVGRLAAGANGTRPEAASGETTGIKWSFPPGYELDYVEKTSNTSVTATTEATANTIVTGSSVAYDGSTIVMIEFFCPKIFVPAGAGLTAQLWLYEDSASIGKLAEYINPDPTTGTDSPGSGQRRRTPSAASHTYSIRGSTSSGTVTVGAGAGGVGNDVPGFIRITKV